MKFPFHLVIEYAQTKPLEMERAIKDFFSGGNPTFDGDLIDGLFGEWLIHDFRQTSNTTFLAEYILKNPDNLSHDDIDNFQQIFNTQIYSEFEIFGGTIGEFMDLEDITDGNVYRVFDKKGSSNPQTKGLLRARIGKVNDKWYLVGANPIYFPMTYTDRMKKMMRKEMKDFRFTPKDTLKLIIKSYKSPVEPPKVPTHEELIKIREDLKNKYEEESKKHLVTFSFGDLCRAIYNENRVNVLDFWQSLIKKGLTDRFLVNNISLLQDVWNYFPHKCLGDKSPVEMYVKLKGK